MFTFRRKHPILEEELSAYLDGQLDTGARERLEAHAESCAACRETLVELRAVRQAVRDLPRAQAPRSFVLREGDVGAPSSASPIGTFARAPSLLGGLATAAVLVFVVLVGVDVTGTSSGGGAADRASSAAVGALEIADEDQIALPPDREDAGTAADGDDVLASALPEAARTGSLEDDEGLLDGSGDYTGPNGEAEGGAQPFYEDEVTTGAEPEGGEGLAPDDIDKASSTFEPVFEVNEGRDASPAPEAFAEADDGGPSRLRVAEGAAAAVALMAAGSFAVIWRRRSV